MANIYLVGSMSQVFLCGGSSIYPLLPSVLRIPTVSKDLRACFKYIPRPYVLPAQAFRLAALLRSQVNMSQVHASTSYTIQDR
jgi:hypothetical protein